MARKFDLISELYRRTSKTVVASPQNWEAFLRSACRNFKLRFDEQLLVFAQRPDATAVLEISNDTKASWNGTFGRWVNRGATGIAVFEDADRSRQRIVHYFDISDTHPSRYARPVPIWSMKPEYTGEVIEALENTFGEMQDKSSLASAIMSAAQNATEDNIPDYISDLLYVTHDSFLEELHPDTVATLYKKVVANSVAYMMMSRLDMDPSMCFEDVDFVDVVNFNTQETLNALGFATSDIAQMGLTEIARTVQSLERQNRTIAANQRDGYNVSKGNTESKDDKENIIERSLENEPNYLHNAGRLQSSQSDNAPTDRSDTGQIRTDAEAISQGEPPGSVLQFADELQDERASGEYRADGIGNGREAGERDGGETGRDRTDESNRHDGLGSQDEQYPERSTGNRESRSDIRLEEDVKLLPPVSQQLSLIETQAEEEKASAFSIPQEVIDSTLGSGSGFVQGKYRIYEQFQKSLSTKENADFLKREYGIGGSSRAGSFDEYQQWHDAKGLKITKGYGQDAPNVLLNWNKVAKRIEELIQMDRYLNDKEKEHYPQWLIEQEVRRAELAEMQRNREILSAAPAEKEEDKPTNFQYEYHLGNQVYLGKDAYEIISIDDERVMLFDTKFPLFNKEMERAAFEEKVQENPLNDHLKVPVPVQEEEVNPTASDREESLATRLHEFYRDFDFYDYQDQLEAEQSEEDVIAEIEEQLEDVQMVRGIRITLEEFKGEDSLLPKQEAAFDKLLSDVTMQEAKLLIDDFCKREYGDNNGADYADLSKIGVAYTTTEDDKHEIQTNVNLTELKIETFVDDTLVYAEVYPNLKSMIENALERLDFDELVAVSDDELAPFYETEKIAPATEVVEETTQDVAQEIKEPVVPSWEQKPRTRVQTFDLHPEVPMADRHSFPLAQHEIAEVNKKERFHRNYAAITVLKKCQQENRFATPDEQKILSRYVGWGGIPEAFDERAGAWHTEYAMLKNILTPEEYNSARESTLTAFYTPQTVISAVYKVMEQMGFREGNILEPSCGIGHFIGMLPASMEGSKIYGIELDTVSAGIAQQLYQKSSIAAQPFEETNLPDSFFDAVVGNVPFGDFKVLDKKYDKYKFLIHDYFFAKSLDKLRPGGVMALITSKGTMDKENPAVRKYIAQRADLLGAIRLPNDTFKGNAGTEVVSDILILQKRDRLIDIEPDWVHLDTDENGITMNSYFVQHPEMILGEMKMVSGRFGPEATCVPYANIDLAPQLEEAIANIHGEINDYETIEELAEEDNSIPADPSVRNFSYTVVDDKIYFRENSRMVPVEASTTAENRIKGMIAIRDCVRALIALQTEDYPDAEIKAEQEKLNTIYDGFVSKYGLINSRANSSAFSQDSSFSLLSALEVLGEGGELERKADMFFKRTIKPHTPVTSVDTSSEALAVSMGEKACVDMEYMMQLSGKPEAEIYQDLKGVIFLNPMYEYGNSTEAKYLMADEYLSGNVREKLAIAKRSAEVYPEDYTLHVEALEKVQPQALSASEIAVRLGATWIPPKIVEQFIFSFLDTPRYAQWNIKTHFSPFTGEWNIEGKSYDRGNVKAYSTYGTSRINAYKIIEETLNLKDVRIFDYVEDDDGKKKAVLNKQETAIAQAKQELIKQGFQDWIWADPQRREKLTTLYNEKFNSIRPREYDGSHITFNGMNPEIELREHQKNAVAHILYGGNTLLAHAVGAGKTFEMVAAAMESKRLGLCNKSLFVVPNHLTEQWAAEFLQLYPSANILVATKKDFETKNRKRFCGRIATGDYDAIIIGHSQFEKIPMSIERQRGILEQQIAEITNGIADLKRNRGDSFSIKQLERTKKSVKVKLDKLNDQSRKDDVVTFEELGVDRLFIDESHYYKNLFLYTKMRNVGGIAQTEAQKSSDLFMKCRYLDEITGGRGTVFATGTPISNSMVELYTIQRYLQYNTLQRNGLQHFDAWASTFGETITAVELTPEGTGYRAKTRFAKFYNLPELMAMFKEVADIKTADMLDLPTPKANYHNVAVKPSDVQKELVASLSERADRVRNGMVDASVDNMLKITNDGRKIALEQRLINDMLPDFAESKLNVCVSNIYRIWNETKENRSAQLVFCDLSTPKDESTFSVYTDIRKKLIALGIPPEEIKFIHEADTEVKKQELFQRTRKGEVRVLLGSTQKMGAGTNVQTKLKALHDIDCPWRPSDLEQRSGRIIRQGNENAEVDIFRYVTEETFDAYLYQLVESKQKFASQIMTSKSPVRSCEDIDETALSYAEIKMLATGNPYIKEKMDLDIQVQKLKLLKSNFLSEKYALEDRIVKYYPQEIARQQAVLAGLKADMALAEKHPKPQDDTFVGMTVQGVFYAEKADAGKEILSVCQTMTSPDPIPLGEYRGFPMELFFDVSGKEYKIKLKGELSYTVALGTDTFGNITRLDNVLEGFSKRLDLVQQELENTEKQFETAKVDVQKPFNQEEELKAKTARLDELNILLNMDKRENEIVGGEPDEGDTDPTPKRKDRAR